MTAPVLWHQLLKLEGDRSEILDESIPLTNDKAFIRTVAHRVSFLEEKVPEAKKSHGAFLIPLSNCFDMQLSHL